MPRISLLLLACFFPGAAIPGVDFRFGFAGTGGEAFARKFGLPYYSLEGNYGSSGDSVFTSVHPDNDPDAGHRVLRKVAKLNVRVDTLGRSNAEFRGALEEYAGDLAFWYALPGSRPEKPVFTWYAPDAEALAAAESLQIVNTIRRGKARVPPITGTVWEIGNEPNLFPALLPAEYAAIHARFHRIIKAGDSAARVAFGPFFVRETAEDLKPAIREMLAARLEAAGALQVLGRERFDSLAADVSETLFARMLNPGTVEYAAEALAAMDSTVRPDYISLHVYPYDDRPPALTTERIRHRMDSLISALQAVSDSVPVWVTEFGNINPGLDEDEVAAATSSLIGVFLEDARIERYLYYKPTGADSQLDFLAEAGGNATSGPPLTRLAEDSAFSPANGDFSCGALNAVGRMFHMQSTGAACSDEAPSLAPEPLVSLPADSEHPPSVALAWASIAGAQGYHVQVYSGPGADPGPDSTILDDTVFIDTTRLADSLDPGRSYYWRVRAFNYYGGGPWSDQMHFMTPGAVGALPAGELPSRHALSVIGDVLHFELPGRARVSIRILDVRGRREVLLRNAILDAGAHKLPLPAAWRGTLYFVDFRTDNHRGLLKLHP